MRSRWSPAWRQGWTPSKPPSHAGPERPTRGSRAIPGPAVRWRWGRRTTTALKRWAGSPRTASPWRTLTTFWGTGLTGDVTIVQPWALGGRRQTSGRGGGVRRYLAVPDPSPMSVSRRPLAGSTALTDATVCSFWPGLTLSPWHLSVVRGTQLPQRVGAHVRRWNSGTHCLLRWSVTDKLLPTGFHVFHELFLSTLDHFQGRGLGNGHCILLRHRGIHRVHTWGGRWHRGSGGRDKRGRGTRKNSAKAQGVEECILGSGAGKVGGGTGEGPPGKGPVKRPVGPWGPVGAAGSEAGWKARTIEVAAAQPRPGHIQGDGGAV